VVTHHFQCFSSLLFISVIIVRELPFKGYYRGIPKFRLSWGFLSLLCLASNAYKRERALMLMAATLLLIVKLNVETKRRL
jgi:hypothetical protein